MLKLLCCYSVTFCSVGWLVGCLGPRRRSPDRLIRGNTNMGPIQHHLLILSFHFCENNCIFVVFVGMNSSPSLLNSDPIVGLFCCGDIAIFFHSCCSSNACRVADVLRQCLDKERRFRSASYYTRSPGIHARTTFSLFPSLSLPLSNSLSLSLSLWVWYHTLMSLLF